MNLSEAMVEIEEIIVSSVLMFSKPKTIILYGGYGRGEGSWIINENKALPYNDFDIAIISENFIPSNEIQEISERIKKMTGIRWVDITQYTERGLGRLKKSIYTYDLRNASRVLYGEKSIIDKIPNFPPGNIPLREIEKLFKIRLWTFVGSVDVNGFHDLTSYQAMFFRNQMAKAVLASVDCIHLLNGSYHHSYKERVLRFEKYCQDSNDRNLVQWALNEKLRPSNLPMKKQDQVDLYLRVGTFFTREFYKGLSSYYLFAVNSARKVELTFLYSPKNFLLRLKTNFTKGGGLGSKTAYIVILQFFCMSYLLKKEKHLLKSIRKYSTKLGISGQNIFETIVEVAELRNKIF